MKPTSNKPLVNNLLVFGLALGLTTTLAHSEDIVYLECHGKILFCGVKDGNRMCDSPIDRVFAIAWDGVTLKHLDDWGVMNYEKGCKSSINKISCFEKIEPNTSGTKGLTTKYVTIERSTGLIKFQNIVATGDSLLKMPNIKLTETETNYEGYCTPRKERNIF